MFQTIYINKLKIIKLKDENTYKICMLFYLQVLINEACTISEYSSSLLRFFTCAYKHIDTLAHTHRHSQCQYSYKKLHTLTKGSRWSRRKNIYFTNVKNFLSNETQVTTRIGHTNLNSSQIQINNDLNKNRYISPATYKTSTRQLEDTTNQMPFK